MGWIWWVAPALVAVFGVVLALGGIGHLTRGNVGGGSGRVAVGSTIGAVGFALALPDVNLALKHVQAPPMPPSARTTLRISGALDRVGRLQGQQAPVLDVVHRGADHRSQRERQPDRVGLGLGSVQGQQVTM